MRFIYEERSDVKLQAAGTGNSPPLETALRERATPSAFEDGGFPDESRAKPRSHKNMTRFRR
jgi:hypothetical protein